MKRNRHQRNLLLGSVFVGATAIGFSTPATSLAENADPAAACQKLATLTSFPVSPTQITLAKFNPAGATSANGKTLLAHCRQLCVRRAEVTASIYHCERPWTC